MALFKTLFSVMIPLCAAVTGQDKSPRFTAPCAVWGLAAAALCVQQAVAVK